MALPKKSDICSICKAQGKTEWHHIISQARIKRLKPTHHNFNNDLSNNPGNLIELCVPCHKQTDSYKYWKWINNTENAKKHTKSGKIKRTRKIKVKPPNPGYDKWEGQCLGTNLNGERCGKRGRSYIGEKYCKAHQHQAPEGYIQNSTPEYQRSPPPGLRDEDNEDRYWSEEHIMTFQDVQMGVPIDAYVLELFEEWSEGWRRKWLYREDW